MSSVFILLTVAAACMSATNAASCLEKTSTFSKYKVAQTACLKTLNLTSADIPTGKDLKEKHFNDRCLSSCAMESMNVYNNGTIQKDEILKVLKSEVASDVYEKLAKSVEKCVEKATQRPNKDHKNHKDGKDKKDKKMTKDFKHHGHGKNVTCGCRRAAKFIYCMLEHDNEATC